MKNAVIIGISLVFIFIIHGCSPGNNIEYNGTCLYFNGEEYIDYYGIYEETDNCLGSVNGYDVYEIVGDVDHNYLVVRSFLDNYLYKKETFVPDNTVIEAVSINNLWKYIYQTDIIECIEKISKRNHIIISDDNKINEIKNNGIEIGVKYRDNAVAVYYGILSKYNDEFILYIYNSKAIILKKEEVDIFCNYCNKIT